MAYDSDETKVSKFNPALLKMQRLHDIRDKINRINQYPFYRDEFGQENYKLKFSLLTSLFKEIAPKLASEELEQTKKLKETIKDFIEKYPPKKNDRGKSKVLLNKANWLRIERALDIYEEQVYVLCDKTGMDTPEEEEYQGL